ncbi:MAG: glycosyltransferase family 9 protein [Alphaproteobacteria bacterium]
MRILFVTANRVGDAVLSSGLYAHLARTHPDARFTVAAGPAAASLFAAAPGLERMIEIRKRRGGRHWWDLWRECAGTRWDMVVDLRRSALAWTLRAGARRIVPKPSALERDGRVHRVRLIAATLGLEATPPDPVVWTGQAEANAAARLMPGTGPVLALAPAANWRGKEWRAERFAELAQRLTAPDGILPGARVAAIAAVGERDQAAAALAAIPPARRIDLTGIPSLATVAACLRRCALFVGNDSGLMHMAAAAGLPTLGLFGPSRTEHYAPWGPQAAALRTPESFEVLTGGPDYDHRTTGTLMDGLTVDTVEAAAAGLWRRVQRDAA